MKISFEFLTFRTFVKLSRLNVKLLFSICSSIYFSIISTKKYEINRLFISSVTQVHVLIISNDYNS